MPIPSYLHVPIPSLDGIPPPAETKKQDLPLEALSWESFERLCLRLSQREADVVDARPYGVQGDDQAGIDLYARLRTGGYATYQCKRVADLGPKKILDAVDLFVGGDWFTKTDRFVLCTSQSLAPKRRADAVETARGKLGTKQFIPWDRVKICTLLKDHPDIVDDFFGRRWTIAFNGSEAAKALGDRLDGFEVATYRRRLAGFYRHIFVGHDFAVPPGVSGSNADALIHQYVPPDVVASVQGWAAATASGSQAVDPEEYRDAREARVARDGPSSAADGDQVYVSSGPEGQPKGSRTPIDSWLPRSDRSVVLGGPGTGKSALLRAVVLDILNENPRFEAVAAKWGMHLPVWMPFGRWTRAVAAETGADSSLSGSLKSWFAELDGQDLWPLVERALEDNRLLLLVDGLDEWTTREAGTVAVHRLQVFLGHRGVPAIVTSRLHGFEELPLDRTAWQIGELAPFSNGQRATYARFWLGRLLDAGVGSAEDVNQNRVERAFCDLESELDRASALDALSRVPLLLSLLVRLQRDNVRLPQNRTSVYEALVNLLLRDQPRFRRRAAGISDDIIPELSDDDFRTAMARLALAIQCEHGGGALSKNAAETVLSGYLANEEIGPALHPRDARRIAREIIGTAQDTLGLLRPVSSGDVAFFHRVLGQFLAAAALAESPLPEQLDALRRHLDNAQWYEVFLSMFVLARRPDDVREFVECLMSMVANAATRSCAERLLAEIAFGAAKCPGGLARQLVSSTMNEIELGPQLRQRCGLLEIAMTGITSARLRVDVVSAVKRWVPDRHPYRESLFGAMARWPVLDDEPRVRAALHRGVHDERPENQLAAAHAVCQRYSDDQGVREALVEIAHSDHAVLIRAAAIQAATDQWGCDGRLRELCRNLRDGQSLGLRVAALAGLASAGEMNGSDWRQLVPPYGVGDTGLLWGRRARSLLARLWKGDLDLREFCTALVETPRLGRSDWRGTEVWDVLLAAFPGDRLVADAFVRNLQSDDWRWGPDPEAIGLWRQLAANFSAHQQIRDTVEAHILEQEDVRLSVDPWPACAAPTERVRDRLISALSGPSSYQHHIAQVLLDGWGMADPRVAATLRAAIDDDPTTASQIGHLIPRIVSDRRECAERLRTLARHVGPIRTDFVLSAGAELADETLLGDLADIILSKPLAADFMRDSIVRTLITAIPARDDVRRLAIESLGWDWIPVNAIASAYGNDREIRSRLCEMAAPLLPELRTIVVERLAGDPELAIEALGDCGREAHATVALNASISYYRAMVGQRRWTPSLTAALLEEIRQGEFDRRDGGVSAAFGGLLIAGKLGDLVLAHRADPSARLNEIPFVDHLHDRTPLVELVAERWHEVAQALEKPHEWFREHFQESEAAFWEALAPFAHHSKALQAAIQAHLATRTSAEPIRSGLLRFIADFDADNPVLVDQCLAAFGRAREDYAQALNAAFLLAEAGRGKANVLERLSQFAATNPRNVPVRCCIAEGWPASAAAVELWKNANGGDLLTYVEYFTFGSRFAAPAWASEAISVLRPVLNDAGKLEMDHGTRRFGMQAICRFLGRNAAAVSALVEGLETATLGPFETLNSVRLIEMAVGVPGRLRAWASTRLHDRVATAADRCLLQYDVTRAEVRSLGEVVAEIVI